ncbi:DEAD/DEAH box helicase [Micromonospora sicca]|uniref:DEAD/DEAH box helicase n=1 Tax=Micromonospora sicca TaxID=2202420 RepID=UPI001F375DDC|nr:DEAD/DEAH box helicase [Micromonospora sp. 4G51]
MTLARLVLTEDEESVRVAVGTRSFVQARAHLDRGELVDVQWDPRAGRAHARLRGELPGTVIAIARTDPSGDITAVEGSCSCGDDPGCAHPAALILAVVSARGVPRPRAVAPPPAWETALSPLVGTAPEASADPVSDRAGVGLQFDLAAAGQAGAESSWRIALRPVVPGRSGWVRSGISWSNLGYAWYGQPRRVERHWQLLKEILALSTAAEDRHYYSGYQQMVYLDAFASRRIWDLLSEAQETGLPMVQAGKAAGRVVVCREPARVSVRVDRTGDDLLLVPTLLADGVPVAPDSSLLVGQPVHGVAWWGVLGHAAPQPRDRVLRLAPLARPLEPGIAGMLANPAIRIPADDEARFFEQYYPSLLRQAELVAADPSVRLPDLGAAALTLTVDRMVGHRLSLRWEWVLPVGDRHHREPLWGPAPVAHAADREKVVRRVTELVADPALGLLESTPAGLRLAATADVAGDTMIRFLNDILPRLTEIDGVNVVAHLDDAGPAYQETQRAPVITFAGADTGGQPDWYDLSVQVTVGGEQVPFDELFVALAADQQYLILPSGTYFSLDRAEFRQLRDLIAESRALDDPPPGVLRVGRFQAGLWQELAELGEVTGQAAAWQEAVRSLSDAGNRVEHPVPSRLKAMLRPYQQDGFRWLAALHEHRLGGVLADDMGLGKTLQALALICHVRELGGARAPFLVVAPASVVHNWASEADRFAPDLVVSAITQTRARRGATLADAVRGADLVVTSYTLFRLEFEDYEAVDWAGLILDEAQFVKNPHSQGYRCAKQLPAPFKLAITGTPMENNLLELWSLLSITAPGLFPRADRFTDHYRNPIEKAHDPERLAQLRRRIRPLMLRRRKADVAADLPDKQEQVIELDLNPKHRKVYQTYLQRERQKVLGLLGDLQQHRFEIFRSLTLLRQASLDVTLVDPKHRAVPSTKLDVLAEQVSDLVAEGHRTLVFSQFTRFLDAARARLEAAGIHCCYLDGATRDRATVLAEFKNGTAPVFLISLKAGGFGLNLTEADYCILLDPWWNPATEAQAVDRVHRIGQTRNVMVYRLVAKDTIEEKVMALKARKAELFGSVLDGGDFASAQLTAADIRDLLQ